MVTYLLVTRNYMFVYSLILKDYVYRLILNKQMSPIYVKYMY